MSATQVVLLALVVVAFALGWLARSRRERAFKSHASHPRRILELDQTLGAALTAFQAALGLWQLEGDDISALGRQALATFEHQRGAARSVAEKNADLGPAVTGAIAALDALVLDPYRQGTTLSEEYLRRLLRRERALTAARHALLRAGIEDRSP